MEFGIAKIFEISRSWDFQDEFSLLSCTPFRIKQLGCRYEELCSESCCSFLWLHLREFSLDISIKLWNSVCLSGSCAGKSAAGLSPWLTGGPGSWPEGHSSWCVRGDVVPLMGKIMHMIMKGAVLRKSNLSDLSKTSHCNKWYQYS